MKWRSYNGGKRHLFMSISLNTYYAMSKCGIVVADGLLEKSKHDKCKHCLNRVEKK